MVPTVRPRSSLIKTTVWLPAEHLARLQKRSLETGLTQSDLIRRGLELVLPAEIALEVRESGRYTGGSVRIVHQAQSLDEGIALTDQYNRQAGRTDAYELWADMMRIYPETDDSSREGMRRIRARLIGDQS